MSSCLALKQSKSTNQTNSKTKNRKEKKNPHRFYGSNSGPHNLTPSILLAELPSQPIYPLPPQPGSKPRPKRFKPCFSEQRPSWRGTVISTAARLSGIGSPMIREWVTVIAALLCCFVESHYVDFTAAGRELGSSCLGLLSAGLPMRSHPAHVQGYILSFEHTGFFIFYFLVLCMSCSLHEAEVVNCRGGSSIPLFSKMFDHRSARESLNTFHLHP